MQIKSKMLPPLQMPHNTKTVIQFEVDSLSEAMRAYEKYCDKDLRLTISKYHKQKTLNQNGYYWVLLNQLAMVLKTTPQELHERNVQNHSIPWTDDEGKHLCISILKGIAPPSVEHLYWKWIRDEGKCSAYMRIKGTSDCNTEEMGMFLDDLIDECKEQGIETATPEELAKIKSLG